MNNKTKIGLTALLAGAVAGQAVAGTFSFTTGDVLVCFRSSANDLVADAGPVSALIAMGQNTTTPITAYTGTQLSQVGTNSVSWSAFAWGSASSPTLYVTRARSSVNIPATPWFDAGYSAQKSTAAIMGVVPVGVTDQVAANYLPAYASSTAVVEQNNSTGNKNYPDGQSYADALGAAYDFGNTFGGDPEFTTDSGFTTEGVVARSDFFQLNPGTGLAVWLGYFQLNTNGLMSYTAYPPSPAYIYSFVRNGNLSTIQYSTGPYATYTLIGTNDITAPQATWPARQALSTGDTLIHTVTDSTTDAIRIYSIIGQ